MSTSENNCGGCNKILPRIRVIKCDFCTKFFRVKCCGINHNTNYSIKQRDGNWHCKTCIVSITNAQDNQSVVDNNVNLNVVNNKSPKSKKKCKCGKCQKNMPI